MTKRAAFFICGVITVLIGRVYGNLGRRVRTQEIVWLRLSYGLCSVGTIAVGISLLPPAWFQRISTTGEELRWFTPFRLCWALQH